MPEKTTSPEDEFFAKEDLEKLKAIRARRDAERAGQAKEQQKLAHWMKCPKCGSDLKETILRNIAVDVCTGCKGVWFDAGELEAMTGYDKNFIARVFGSFRDVMKFGEPVRDGAGDLEKKK